MSYKKDYITPNFYTTQKQDFKENAIALFHYQYHRNEVYQSFCNHLHIQPKSVKDIYQIPFLPISFFKTHKVLENGIVDIATVFESSGTTGETNSKHYIADEHLYKLALLSGFEKVYGNVQDYTILALLPSYIERPNASLVYMTKCLMEVSQHEDNGFFLNEWEQLANRIQALEKAGKKTILVGVTFALIDFAEQYPMHLEHTIVMETGGMKGRRTEWTRQQVHSYLKQQWGLQQIHAEYGMTELLSQAYATANGIFKPSPSMVVLARDINDPLEVKLSGSGCLNIIDLANVYSCAFIATDDIGSIYEDGCFEVLGRADHSALRGCNLMVV